MVLDECVFASRSLEGPWTAGDRGCHHPLAVVPAYGRVPWGCAQRNEKMFDTKIAIVLRNDLAVWQKLNVTAFLTSGIVGANPGILGERYEDAAGNTYNSLAIQPMIVLGADRDLIKTIYRRAMERGARLSLYIEDMFSTGHDAANRATVRQYRPEAMNIVGLALREDKKTVDKITKGTTMHACRATARKPSPERAILAPNGA